MVAHSGKGGFKELFSDLLWKFLKLWKLKFCVCVRFVFFVGGVWFFCFVFLIGKLFRLYS